MLSEMFCTLSDFFVCEIITLFLETIMTTLIIVIHYKVIQSCPSISFCGNISEKTMYSYSGGCQLELLRPLNWITLWLLDWSATAEVQYLLA